MKTRLDVALVDRGLAGSRERARALIMAGQVRVDGQVVSKAGTNVDVSAAIELDGPDHPYVSRGGVKLAHALDDFNINPSSRRALDVGASTGGFTDVLLRRGATSVIALDVGHGQLDWKLRTDPRVDVHDGVNARRLTAEDVPHPVDLVVIDVSFISLGHILASLPPFLADGADIVALVTRRSSPKSPLRRTHSAWSVSRWRPRRSRARRATRSSFCISEGQPLAISPQP